MKNLDKTLYFDSVKDIIIAFDKYDRPKEGDKDGVYDEIVEEKKKRWKGNPYLQLADDFENLNANSNADINDKENLYFYKYLKSLNCSDSYTYQLQDRKTIKVSINIFEPYFNDEPKLVNPKWHYLISWFAFKDAAHNHKDNAYANEILKYCNIPNNFKNIKNNKVFKKLEPVLLN